MGLKAMIVPFSAPLARQKCSAPGLDLASKRVGLFERGHHKWRDLKAREQAAAKVLCACHARLLRSQVDNAQETHAHLHM